MLIGIPAQIMFYSIVEYQTVSKHHKHGCGKRRKTRQRYIANKLREDIKALSS